MRVYFDFDTEKLMNEQEAHEEAEKEVMDRDLHLQFLQDLCVHDIWDLLSDEGKNAIIKMAVNEIMDRYIYKDFE